MVLALELFMPLIWEGIGLDPDLVLALHVGPPIPFPSSLLPPSLSLSLSLSLLLSLYLIQPRPPPPIRPVYLSAAILNRFCPYLSVGPFSLAFCQLQILEVTDCSPSFPPSYPQDPPYSESEIVFGPLQYLSLPFHGLYRCLSF